jgi:uncharacterized protein YjbI with pentapeptide repeats
MQLQNFLDLYRQGERNFAGVDLSGAILTGANLRDINLSGANLNNANLSWACLNNTNLTGASFHQTNLHSATLNYANFNQAILSRAKLSKVDLRWSTLQDTDLNWADLTNSDLSGSDLQRVKLNRANLEQAKLNNTMLMGAEIMEANFKRTSLIAANLAGANLRESNLEKSILREAILVGVNLTEANLNAAYLRGANLIKADLHRAILTDADLSEANCDGADMSRANLTGAYLLKASLRQTNLLRAILPEVYLLRTDLTQANLRGADLRRADLSGAYLKDACLSEANLSDSFLLESYLIRTKLEGTKLTGCCIHSWRLEEVDLSKVECYYVFNQFNFATKSKSERYPPIGDLQPGELSRPNTADSLTIEIQFPDAPNWEVLVFTLAQVELDYAKIKLTIDSYELTQGQYLLRLSANNLVNAQLISQRILQLYPQLSQRFSSCRQSILDLLEINKNRATKSAANPKSKATQPPPSASVDRRRRMYLEVINQMQLIVTTQNPEQFIDSLSRLLEFLKEHNISTEEIQKKVISQSIIKRAEKDQMFQNQLLQWQENAEDTARYSIVGEAVSLAIASLFSQAKSP